MFAACTDKTTIYETEHNLEVVEGNIPPSYDGVTTVQLDNYINKFHIDLIGREPTAAELEDTRQYLRDNDISDAAVDARLAALMVGEEYYQRFTDIYRGSVLNGVDSAAIMPIVNYMEGQVQVVTDEFVLQYFENELIRLYGLLSLREDYQAGVININAVMTRLVHNYFYDEINMGAENFVLATFENLFKRLPTEAEILAGTTMFNGFPAQLLHRDGATKEQLIQILTEDPEFYQGLGIDIYRQLLARNPDSEEMAGAAIALGDGSLDYQALQRQVIKTEEYRGF